MIRDKFTYFLTTCDFGDQTYNDYAKKLKNIPILVKCLDGVVIKDGGAWVC